MIQPLGQEWYVSQKLAAGVMGMSEVSEGLSASDRSESTCHSLCAGC